MNVPVAILNIRDVLVNVKAADSRFIDNFHRNIIIRRLENALKMLDDEESDL